MQDTIFFLINTYPNFHFCIKMMFTYARSHHHARLYSDYQLFSQETPNFQFDSNIIKNILIILNP